MLRKLLGAGLLLATLAGCTKLEGRECSTDGECGEGGLCDTAQGLCYAKDVEEPDGGSCSPACPEYEACVRGACRPRFTGLNILSPANSAVVSGSTDGGVDGGAVAVMAELVLTKEFTVAPLFPATLAFSATLSGGGGEPGTFGAVSHNNNGVYTVPWTPPMVQGQVTLTAAHPDPAAGLSQSVSVTVDAVAPTFNISLPPFPTRSMGSSAVQADQRDTTTGFAESFRRDESVTVTVSANEPALNVVLTVEGIGAGGGAGQTQTLTLQPATTCPDSPPFCQSATLDFSLPEMVAFRGNMTLRVTGRDAAGNTASATRSVPVTRWKWAFDPAGNILGTPAIGSRGTIYFGTSAPGPTGKAFAVNPDGTRKWEATTGEVLGSVAVGEFASNTEYVYVAAKAGSIPTLYALNSVDGSDSKKCTYNGANELPSAIAVGTTTGSLGATLETAVTVYNSPTGRAVKMRPNVNPLIDDQCLEFVGVLQSLQGGSMVLSGTNVFYGTNDFKVTSYDIGPTTGSNRGGWPQNTIDFNRSLAILDDKVYGATSDTDSPTEGGLFSAPTAGGAISSVYPAGSANSRVFNFSIGPNNIAYFGAESTQPTKELLAFPLNIASPQITRASGVGIVRGAPVVGKNDRLYTLNDAGRVSAWTASTLAPQWNVELPSVLANSFVSPTLDCRRTDTGQPSTGPGILYIGASSRLYAFIVDSPGLANAPWPKFQRDARNTGNPATPITNCP